MRKRSMKRANKRFRRGTYYTLVSPSGHATRARVLDIVSLGGTRRGLLLQMDRRGLA